MRRSRTLLTAALLALTGAGQAQEPAKPAPVQYACRLERNFLAPTWTGKRPTFVNRTLKGDQPKEWEADAKTGPENIYGNAIVDGSGAILNLHMAWIQSGAMGWPYFSRADLDEIVMTFKFGSNLSWITPDAGQVRRTRFDPDQLTVEIEAQQLKKIKQLLVLRVSQRGYGLERRSLGGLADIPAWRKSASIFVPWPELQALAGSEKLLEFNLSTPVLRPNGLDYLHIRSGHLDLTPVPVVLDQFRAAEAQLQDLARDPARNCIKLEEPTFEDNPLADI